MIAPYYRGPFAARGENLSNINQRCQSISLQEMRLPHKSCELKKLSWTHCPWNKANNMRGNWWQRNHQYKNSRKSSRNSLWPSCIVNKAWETHMFDETINSHENITPQGIKWARETKGVSTQHSNSWGLWDLQRNLSLWDKQTSQYQPRFSWHHQESSWDQQRFSQHHQRVLWH